MSVFIYCIYQLLSVHNDTWTHLQRDEGEIKAVPTAERSSSLIKDTWGYFPPSLSCKNKFLSISRHFVVTKSQISFRGSQIISIHDRDDQNRMFYPLGLHLAWAQRWDERERVSKIQHEECLVWTSLWFCSKRLLGLIVPRPEETGNKDDEVLKHDGSSWIILIFKKRFLIFNILKCLFITF